MKKVAKRLCVGVLAGLLALMIIVGAIPAKEVNAKEPPELIYSIKSGDRINPTSSFTIKSEEGADYFQYITIYIHYYLQGESTYKAFKDIYENGDYVPPTFVLKETTITDLIKSDVISDSYSWDVFEIEQTHAGSGAQLKIHLRAVGDKATVKVTFNSQGGSKVSDIADATINEKITQPVAPTKDGYTFGGWYKEASCINAWNFSSDVVTEDTMLFAKWNKDNSGNGKEPEPINIENYKDVDISAGIVKDITNSSEVPKSLNPYNVSVVNYTELEKLAGITAAEKAQGVNLWLEVKDAKNKISSADKSLIDKAGANLIIGMYLDASLFKKVGNGDTEPVHTLNGKIKISFMVPESLRAENREYRFIRVHDGVTTVIPGTYDSKTGIFTFETDKFSAYALAYTDKNAASPATSPKTGEAQNMPALLSFIGLCGLMGLLASRKRA